NMMGYKSGFSDWVDEQTGVNELGYNPDDYEATKALQGLARMGGNVVGDPLNAIPGGYLAGKLGKELGGEIVNQAVKPSMSTQGGMVGYHGSPHKFDRFDHSKMGTGEGAQAYGWGTYIAESDGTAKAYYDDFADLGERTNVDGDTYERLKGAWRKDGEQAPTDIDLALDSLRDVEWDKDSAIKDLELYIKNEKEFSGAGKIIGEDIHIGQAFYTEDEVQSAINRIKASEFEKTPEAYMYEVDLPDEKISQMLDWDAPLSEQPLLQDILQSRTNIDEDALWNDFWENAGGGVSEERAADVLEKYQAYGVYSDEYGTFILDELRESFPNTHHKLTASGGGDIAATDSGESLYRLLESELGGDAAASQKLKELGIPGIKYFDGSSRSAGEGTRNFVVFDENDMSILSRNGEKALP
ncbi:MAG: hypothetical protein GY774_15415, partial [Planctomycetes bacterium]|nr:hypothetical protein [Planctomycetota bacterium]